VEELGWFGGVGLIALFGALIWRGFVIARRAPDMLGTLLASGLVIWIGLEAMINMAVMVGLLPFAGNALPFVSAGGSNLVTTLAALGILFNISRQGNSSNETNDEWRSYGAVANLRWWNGRGRVSRASRLRSAKE
jgi:cell division protein FtsW